MVNRTNELIKKTNECSLSTIHFLDAPLNKKYDVTTTTEQCWIFVVHLELTFYIWLWKMQQKLLSVTRMETKTSWKTMFRLFLHDTLCTSQKLQPPPIRFGINYQLKLKGEVSPRRNGPPSSKISQKNRIYEWVTVLIPSKRCCIRNLLNKIKSSIFIFSFSFSYFFFLFFQFLVFFRFFFPRNWTGLFLIWNISRLELIRILKWYNQK